MITTEQSIAWARECGAKATIMGEVFTPDELTALCNLAYAKGVEDAAEVCETEQRSMMSDYCRGVQNARNEARELILALHPAPKGAPE